MSGLPTIPLEGLPLIERKLVTAGKGTGDHVSHNRIRFYKIRNYAADFWLFSAKEVQNSTLQRQPA
jgi:hypothetical protein